MRPKGRPEAPRFFVAPGEMSLADGADVPLPAPIARHAVQVLRLRDAAPIVLFDGRGGEYDATLAIGGREVRARVSGHDDVERERAAPVWLVQALVAHDAMDTIVRKAVELGVAGIAPVLAARSQRTPGERGERRLARWQQIAVAACEQCGRNRVPPILAPVALDAWIAQAPPIPRSPSLAAGAGLHAVGAPAAPGPAARDALLLDPAAAQPLARAAMERTPRALIVGPEGGFTDDEVHQLAAAGARRAQLGPTVLRADTAALAALAAVYALAPLAAGDAPA